MAFVNTRDTIGDQATVDGLVSHSLTELKEDGIGIVETYACYHNTGLQSLELPNVSQIKENAFDGCSNLEVAKLGGEGSSNSLAIESNAFNSCEKLKHLIIDRPVKASLVAPSGLSGTPIDIGDGAVYVPESLVPTYKADSVWKNYFITRLEKYPLSAFDTIEDSWSTILSNASYATDYAVKDTKTLELTDGTKIKMDLAAIDTDVKSDNSGTAKLTWICHGVPYNHAMSSTYGDTTGGWADSDMRSWLISDILSKIPTEIKSHIVSVKKSYRSKKPNDETLWSDDEIWIPSYREVGFTSESYIESDGVTYPILFLPGNLNNANISRKKTTPSSPYQAWWVRSCASATSYNYVNYMGKSSTVGSSSNDTGVVFGFCTD